MKEGIEIKNINPNKKAETKTNKKKLSTKRIVSLILITILVIVVITIIILYLTVTSVRDFMDEYILGKIVTEDNLVSVQLDYESDVTVFGYSKYICVLAENTLKQYNSSGTLANEIELVITTPVYSVNSKYLAISEDGGTKIYVISDNKILWEKEVDGNIDKITINKNGYVAVVLSGTAYKSVIATYDSNGTELFKTYLSSTTAQDVTISQDNEYLAFAEINTSGTTIQSNIKIISVSEAQENPSDSIIFTYEADSNSLVTNIEYQKQNMLVCMYDDAIHLISNEQDEVIMELEDDEQNIEFADIRLTNYIYRAIEKSTGLFQANTIIEMLNIETTKETVYTIDGVVKSIYCFDDMIAVNLGQELEIFNTSGWMLKQYSSSQDIQDVTFANNMAGIIYRDRVEIINL